MFAKYEMGLKKKSPARRTGGTFPLMSDSLFRNYETAGIVTF
jgi:hypothetical protein